MVQSLGAFGEVEDEEELADLDLEPVPFTLVGYEVKRNDEGEHARREYEFHVMPTQSFGPLFTALQATDVNGNIPMSVAVQFVADALIADDRERWTKTLRDPEVNFQAKILSEIAEAVAALYGMRPTPPRSERRAGPRRTGTTSTAGRSGRVSASSRSRQGTR